MIADNVGDNVGDCAGMAVDLFETYAVTAVAVMLSTAFPSSELVAPARARRHLDPRVRDRTLLRLGRPRRERDHQRLYRSVIVATVLSAIGFIPVTLAFDDDRFLLLALYVPALIGLGVTFLLVAITEYYTGSRWHPVKKIAEASQTGHATNIIAGLAYGMQGATAFPVLVIALPSSARTTWRTSRSTAWRPPWRSSMTVGLIVALDAYGPVTDNAGGIAEMADMPESVRQVTDPLDAVGNTTKKVAEVAT